MSRAPMRARDGDRRDERPTTAVLMKGNEAIVEGAIRANCQAYFGYPITPQSEILESMAHRMTELGRVFIQAESELAAINMVFGASAAGMRVMTSSSGPGMSLKQEGISFLTAAGLPAVIVDVMRAGPGLGGILPGQADYFQATKGGGHGDYHSIVLAPASAQEAMDLTTLAFDLSDAYRNPVLILADGLIGQAMEPVVVTEHVPLLVEKPWALSGAQGRQRNIITSLFLRPEELETHNLELVAKYARIAAAETRFEEYQIDDADIVVVSYGSPSRVVKSALEIARQTGIRAGLFRPITLFPFPYERLRELAERMSAVLVVELSAGQLAEDVRLAVPDRLHVGVHSRYGGMLPSPEEIVAVLGGIAKNGRG